MNNSFYNFISIILPFLLLWHDEHFNKGISTVPKNRLGSKHFSFLHCFRWHHVHQLPAIRDRKVDNTPFIHSTIVFSLKSIRSESYCKPFQCLPLLVTTGKSSNLKKMLEEGVLNRMEETGGFSLSDFNKKGVNIWFALDNIDLLENTPTK